MKNFTCNFRHLTANGSFIWLGLSIVSIFVLCVSVSFGQNKTLIKRTNFKTEKADFGSGGTVSIVGAPMGSITVEGWQKNEVEVSAEIVIQAENEADLELLSKINGFVLDNDFGHIRIVTVGTNDKEYLKRVAKKFPKQLMDKPFKIDFRIKVPTYTDLEINGGHGNLTISKVEGAMKIKVLEGNGNLTLTGGTVDAVFGSGNVDVNIAARSWRGRSADFQLAGGQLNVVLLPNLNADINASILRSGKIENSVAALKPRPRAPQFTEKSMSARAGNGGVVFNFTVGDGTLVIKN